MKQNIILIGMPGTGKSTVGVVLAKRLGFDFIDCDLLLAKEAGMTLPEILDKIGIDGFLEMEGRVGAGLRCSRTVIATGGSMVISPEAMANLKSDGTVVWLETRLNELERRIARNPDRGIAADAGTTVADIYSVREPLYEKYADIRIKCRQGVDAVVAQIRSALKEQ